METYIAIVASMLLQALAVTCYAVEPAVLPSGQADLRGKATSKQISLTMVNRRKGLLRIANHTKNHIKLLSIFSSDEKQRFSPAIVVYEVQKDGKWINIPYPINTFAYDYRLHRGESVVFEITLDAFEYANVPKGSWVRIKVGGGTTKPFKW